QHGRLKVKSSVEIEKEKSNEKRKKLMYYKKIISDIQNMDLNLEYLDELLKLTSEVLRMNPDYYTFWNIRKKLFQKLKAESKTECEALMIKELNFLNECLKLNPKSYSVWHHRCFITEFMDRADWPLELELTSKFLECDNRNFHCWDYRRFVFSKCTTSPESELLFSTKKISMDFSNFSSWHYRSKLISQIHPNLFVDHMDVISREYSLVENAIFTDPSDQSGWFYLKWLIDKSRSLIFSSCPNML
ncbi:hypothetical protein HELRODRAFT_86108, partial [Helobdella robusta]|uniref:Geranylgeranyl transferase type-2 subunit alpha n=1 Tax=Helobdella robusta TaxID=6412 RepID=T1G675_HELRO